MFTAGIPHFCKENSLKRHCFYVLPYGKAQTRKDWRQLANLKPLRKADDSCSSGGKLTLRWVNKSEITVDKQSWTLERENTTRIDFTGREVKHGRGIKQCSQRTSWLYSNVWCGHPDSMTDSCMTLYYIEWYGPLSQLAELAWTFLVNNSWQWTDILTFELQASLSAERNAVRLREAWIRLLKEHTTLRTVTKGFLSTDAA